MSNAINLVFQNILIIGGFIVKLSKLLTKKIIIGVSALTFAFALAGCGEEQQAAAPVNEKYPVSWTETLDGQEVNKSVDKAPTRAISMSQATTEMLLALGLDDKMVGTAMKEEDIYPPLQEFYDKVKVLSDKWPSYEVFMAENPDFATGWEVAFTKRGIPAERITAQNVPIFVPSSMQKLDADLNTVFEDMIKLGEIFDVREDAQIWIDAQKNMLESIQGKISNLPKKKVFIYDSSDGQPFTAFKGYTTNILKLIGAENVMEGAGVDKTWAATSWESVVAADPEYIIIADYSNGVRNDEDFQQKVAAIKDNPQLQNVTAVRENHFIKVKLSEITPGVRTVES
ncbi:MAG: ABC transporter substrate-binding protein, partial [Selenomonadaceae bacterium]|nr:ABC transporter substrate-binding protein [Selenomonadaceae bacterium]